MPVTFRIIQARGLVLVRFSGAANVDELAAASRAYAAHPDYVAGQKQLIDLTEVTDFKSDYVKFMAQQAAKAERLEGTGVQSLAVYVAPTQTAREVANLFTHTWGHAKNVVVRVMNSEAEALAVVGQRESSIAALLANTGHTQPR